MREKGCEKGDRKEELKVVKKEREETRRRAEGRDE